MSTILKRRWLSFCEAAGLNGSAKWQDLSAAYEDPSRAYHNLDHIADCLVRFDEHIHLAINPVTVEFAIWFHDIVYDTHAADNEERSAVVAAEFLSATSHGPAVAALILATRHDGQPGTADASLLCDIDLSILGRAPAVYDAYAIAIRQEYSWVPPEDYAKGRTQVLEGFLGRPSIFVMGELEKAYGSYARVNLLREIVSLADTVADHHAP
jgi:predicted metal-dependent HD superfamily phosphohydrolase